MNPPNRGSYPIRYLKGSRYFILVVLFLLLSDCQALGVVTGAMVPGIIPLQMLQAPSSLPALASIPLQNIDNRSKDGYILELAALPDNPVERYGLLELDLQTNLQAVNPYDPNELELRVRFTSPSGREVVVGAFWYQDFDLQTRQPSGEPGWKVRFTPDETGVWKAVAFAPALGLESTPVTFEVGISIQPGFIRIHPSNPHYLAFDNGQLFFPVGVNMGWWGDSGDPLDQYGMWLDHFTANGGNTIRVWMASWSFGIEWKDTGLGDYDQRLYQAWQLDQLFRLADEHGVKIILVLLNHGPLSLFLNSEWNDNPYNAALGGTLSNPAQFVSDPVARAYYQRRLSYIINRWGYSPDLLAWEWFNEVNLTPITDEALIPWLQEMTVYLRQRDVNHHLTTNSFAMRTVSSIWQLPELDIAQKHEYSSQIDVSDHDLAGRAAQDFNHIAQSMPLKPILMGEFGYSATNTGENDEKTGIHLHNGLWATTFSGYAGSGMYWWWDEYIDANNLWYHFKGLSDFLKGVDLSQYHPFSPLDISRSGSPTGQAVGLGMRNQTILVWIRNSSYTVQASIAARAEAPGMSDYQPPIVEDLYLTLDGMSDGGYTVRWYNPQTASWLNSVNITAQDHILTVPIPPFRDDLAAKIIRSR